MQRVLLTLTLACMACASPTGRDRSPSTPRTSAPPHVRASERTVGPRAIIRLTSDQATDGRVKGELHFEGALANASALRFAPTHGAHVDGLVVRDASGEIAWKAVPSAPTPSAPSNANDTRFELARPASHELDVSYSVVLDAGASGDEHGGLAEPIEFRGSGEDLLVLPEIPERDDQPIPIELHLHTGGSSVNAASSFGHGIEQRPTARLSELHHAYFLAGDIGKATFHAGDGDDLAGWLGHTAFDPRWVSAESVGIRSAVDAWVGRMPSADTPPLMFLFSATKRDEPPFIVIPRTRGMLVSADRRAVWNAPARIAVSQALTQRYIGGFVRVGDPATERGGAGGAFFREGFSRTIAREVLFEANLLDPIDRAAELNLLLTAFTFAEDPVRKAAANGALVATALDVALQDQRKSLRVFVRELLAKAATEHRSELSRPELMALIQAHTSKAVVDRLERALDKGEEVALPADLMGRCFQLKKSLLVLFELGFVTSAGEELVVTSVKSGSRAAAAGIRVGDVLTEVRYEAGKTQVPVELVRNRKGEKPAKLRFFPVGPSKPGRLFERLPGVPNERC